MSCQNLSVMLYISYTLSPAVLTDLFYLLQQYFFIIQKNLSHAQGFDALSIKVCCMWPTLYNGFDFPSRLVMSVTFRFSLTHCKYFSSLLMGCAQEPSARVAFLCLYASKCAMSTDFLVNWCVALESCSLPRIAHPAVNCWCIPATTG